MGRAPCCEKMGLKKGPWTSEEDEILISYIQKHGHSNWRALPKQAGLLRCGKSCRLRWINYLRPDVKRGNFSREEEDAIISLHQKLGNKWSAIAAKLPGRTDNEIKNVWHTHLKKRLTKQNTTKDQKSDSHVVPSTQLKTENLDSPTNPGFDHSANASTSSPQPCSSDFSTLTDSSLTTSWGTHNEMIIKSENMESIEAFSYQLNEEMQFQFPSTSMELVESETDHGTSFDGDMDFWYNLFIEAGGATEFPEF